MPFLLRRTGDIITSRSNQLIVKIGKLEDKKHRDAEGLFRFDGVKLFIEAITFGVAPEYVFIKESREKSLVETLTDKLCGLSDKTIEYILVGDSAFEKMTDEKAPDGIIFCGKYLDKLHKSIKISNENLELSSGRLLMLESVRDPGNLGTILRCAAAFGISQIVMTDDCADIYNPKTIRASMGALFKVSTLKTDDLPDTVRKIKDSGRRVFATALNSGAMKLGQFEISDTDVFLVGNEGHGLSAEAIEASSGRVFIPMTVGTESLNAAVAAALCMWEASRKSL